MDIEDSFDEMQDTVDVPPDDLKEARRRRDAFLTAFNSEPDVVETIPSGSLARRSHKDPIKDVDVIVVYDSSDHPDWGNPGESAEEALEYTRGRVNILLHHETGTSSKEVRLTALRNHSVKCFIDPPEDPSPFTVDVTPALRQDDGVLLIPERESKDWIRTNPEDLIRRVAGREASWNQFVKLVRCLKRWATDNSEMKGLLIEVMALDHLPEGATRDRALARYFTAAADAVLRPVEDPAGECGEIQPDLDRAAASQQLDEAATNAWRGVEARDDGDDQTAACHWRTVFGDIFPEPPSGCGNGNAAAATVAAGISFPPKRRPMRDNPQG